MNRPCLQALQCPEPFVIKNRLKESEDGLLLEAIEWIFQDPNYCLTLLDKLELNWS
jgi:hypothetical protein